MYMYVPLYVSTKVSNTKVDDTLHVINGRGHEVRRGISGHTTELLSRFHNYLMIKVK